MKKIKLRVSEKNSELFPQANDFYNIIKRLDMLTYNLYQNRFKTINIDLTERQEHYYVRSLEYLELVKHGKPTELSLFIMSLDFETLLICLVKIILENKIFYDYYVNRNNEESLAQIKQTTKLSESTSKRRLSTVKSWISWCDNIISDFKLEMLKI